MALHEGHSVDFGPSAVVIDSDEMVIGSDDDVFIYDLKDFRLKNPFRFKQTPTCCLAVCLSNLQNNSNKQLEKALPFVCTLFMLE
ncbi:hypothetical protein [Niallia circulans]|nr:hypothetical protein [Niallia circulans]